MLLTAFDRPSSLQNRLDKRSDPWNDSTAPMDQPARVIKRLSSGRATTVSKTGWIDGVSLETI